MLKDEDGFRLSVRQGMLSKRFPFLEQDAPDIILLDISLPDMDGAGTVARRSGRRTTLRRSLTDFFQ
ncbi:MAG: hypothetical protein WDO15_09640 [Bacteroidota bacterium]